MQLLRLTWFTALVVLAVCLLLAGCASGPAASSGVARIPWSTPEAALTQVFDTPRASNPGAPAAVHLLIPKNQTDAVYESLSRAFAMRGYELCHKLSESSLDMTGCEVLCALGDPVELIDVESRWLAPISAQLWLKQIPYGVRPWDRLGSRAEILVPRLFAGRARDALDKIVPAEAWRDPRASSQAVQQGHAADGPQAARG